METEHEDLMTGFLNGFAEAPTFQEQGESQTPATQNEPPAQTGPSELDQLRAQLAANQEETRQLRAQMLAPTFQQQGQTQQMAPPTNTAPAKSAEEIETEYDARLIAKPTRTVAEIVQKLVAHELQKHVEPLRQETATRTVDSFLTEKSGTDGVFDRVAPVFRDIMADKNLQANLSRMEPSQRRQALESIYDAATGRAFRAGLNKGVEAGKLKFQPAPSYGAGYQPVRQAAPTQQAGLGEVDQAVYNRLTNGGMSHEDAMAFLQES